MDTYEKKYNDALNDMRAIYPNLNGDAKLAVEHAFPELRESEDERTRKELLDYVKYNKEHTPETIPGEHWDRWISYLEKQKEPKLAPYDLQKSFEAGQTSIVDNPEQYGLCKKAEWSEEDDRVFEFAIARVEIYERDFLHGNNEMSERLKALHPRPSWKPSEEQMSALLWCIAHLGGADRRVLAELYEHLKMYCK